MFHTITVTDTEFSVTYELVNDEVAKELRKRKYGDVYQFVFETSVYIFSHKLIFGES